MAEILYHKIQFTGTNPYGDYVAGDVIELYYDDSVSPPAFPGIQTSGIVVYKNSVEILSGADIATSSESYKSELSYNPLVCSGTSSVTVLRTNMAFPYAYLSSFPNHPLCAANGPVCDLQFGTPVITGAGENQTDGTVTVLATSSNSPIEYRLNYNFAYGDGTGQSSGTFTGLAAGQYRIFARDSVNCSANIVVIIPEKDTAYNPLYRLEYDDPVGGVSRLDIVKRNYSGDVTEVKGAQIGFERSLKGEASQDKFESLLATKATLHLTSETNFAFSGLYTNNPDEFRINYYKLTDASSSVSLPALSTWSTGSTSASKPDWTTGAAPSVTIAGSGYPNHVLSELLYVNYAFIVGRAYTLTFTFTRVTNSGSSNPRTGILVVTDTSDNIIFQQAKSASEGSNSIVLSFTANVQCERIAFYYSSGSNVTITANSISGTIDGFATQGIYKVLPQQYSEDYKAPPYYVSVVATDGIPGLKDYIFLQDDGQRFHNSMKSIELIAYILKKTGLSLSIRVAINLYATGMNTAATDDPLDQAYIDCDTYYINEQEPTLDYVLRQIIEPYGARIVQENAVWNIVRVEEMRGEYDYREFDSNGAYVSNSSYDPRLSVAPVGSEGFHFSDRDHFMQMCPGYGKIRVFYKLGLRENILENGDFRLNSVYVEEYNQYFFNLDTTGFQVVNAGYPITQSWESAGPNNVAFKIQGDSNVVAGYGDAYILSDTYNVKMGVDNTLKISIRYKLPPPVAYGLTPIPVEIQYQKVRIRVKYGSYYLLSDGTWSTDENFLLIYATEFDKYLETDFTATQPATGAVNGYDLEVRVYHSYIYHAEYTTFDGLRGKVTYDSPDAVLPLGARSEVSALGAFELLYYYELQETTDAEDEPNIIRPNDYHSTNNPVQWVLKGVPLTKTYFTSFTSPFWVDFIKVKFLINGAEPLDTILREIRAENRNTAVLDKEVTHGSYQSLITTLPQWDFGVGKLTATSSATLSLITTNVLAAETLYAGYLRDSSGTGWTTWTRDGVFEASSLHAILLQQYAAQYKRSWRKLTGSFYSQSKYFNFLNVLKIVSDSNRLYLPISPTIDDVNNRVRGEFLELTDITASAGSDGSGNAPFTSGFTSGFGGAYN